MITMSDGYFQDGAAESSAIFHEYYGLSRRWGKNRPVGLTKRFVSPPPPKPEPGPYAEIRSALVLGIRNSAKPPILKQAAEVLICAIDEGATETAIQQAHAHFMRVAEGRSLSALNLTPAEIAARFELGAHSSRLQ